MSSDIWFGAHVPPEGRDFEEMKRICLMAEEGGFDLFTVTDHFMKMRDPNSPTGHPLECWTTLAGLSAITRKIKLGPLVTCYAYRRPTLLAKMATTVDIISKGRFILGIGACPQWAELEFKGFLGRFPPPSERVQGLKETVEICKKMLTNYRTSYYGKIYQVNNVLNLPPPAQRSVPIMIGGRGERVTMRIAAKYADISHVFTGNLEMLEHKLTVLKKHCTTVGREYNEIRKATAIRVLLGRTQDELDKKLNKTAKSLDISKKEVKKRVGVGCGTTKNVIDVIDQYVNRGIGLITFQFHDTNDIKLLAEEVIPEFK